MGFYSERVFPYLMNLAMNNEAMRDERRRGLEGVSGSVLEVGFGSGLNLPHYPPAVTKVVGVDPSERSARLARKRIAASPFPVDVIGLSAERLPVADGSFETVVSTFTLCTIPDVAGALTEMRRVLAPAGRLYFVEHGRAEDPRVVRWQERLNPIQRVVCAGCHLNRPIATLVEQAGFAIEQLETGYMKGAPRFVAFHYRGVARKAGPRT
jgi:ubiquinone/menaquinone biosynthesis C-methylase UbiE